MRAFVWAGRVLNGRARVRASVLRVAALFAACAGAAFGCGWYGTEHSVRFNAWRDERLFGRLPPLPFNASARTTPDYRDEDGREEAPADDRDAKATALWARVNDARGRRDFEQLRQRLNEFLAVADAEECGVYADATVNCRHRLNTARDLLDALDSRARGASARAVSAYLDARGAYDRWLPTQDAETADEAKSKMSPEEAAAPFAPVEAALAATPHDANISDNVEYLRAAALYESGERARAVEAFERLAARHPRSEKREAALLNAGILRMRESGVGFGVVEHAASDDPCADCKDEAWRRAAATFGRMLREHPRGRHAGEARGWLAYLHVRVEERAEGLAQYYRMLADEVDGRASAEGLKSLALVRHGADEADMKRVESLLEAEPRAALAYAYYEIYNATPGGGLGVEVSKDENPYRHCIEDAGGDTCYSDYYRWEEKERAKRQREAERKAFARVAAFATRLMLRSHGPSDGGAFALRVAQADLELEEYKPARALASRALAAGLAGDERASALWVRGVAEYRLKEFDASTRTFKTLLAEFPEGDLAEGARRHMAMAAEDSGDLEGALEQYLALHYKEDIAYFVDVLLTAEQLASFAERHKESEWADVLFYSLGVRHMRANRFAEARAAYARVRTRGAADAYAHGYGDDECERRYKPPHCSEVKNPRWQEWEGVRAEWVARDLKTMDEIERLKARYVSAAGDEESAEALYQLASYVYQSGDLTFYNPAAWRGLRFYALYYDQQLRAPGEAILMRRYMEEHEPLARALDIYLRVAEEHPRTRAARDSLYTAAVIHERLAGFELYWPGQYKHGLHAGARMVTYDDVRRTYPDYSMPSGTYGWEPLTRTVGGQAAWPAPPKPKRLTGMERARLKVRRAERRVEQAWELFGELYDGRVRAWTVAAARWTVAAFVAFAALTVFRRTRRTRRFLYRRLTRGAAAPRGGEARAPKSTYAAHASYLWSEGPRSAAARAAAALFRLALHERGRAALALNLFTHGLLTLLLWALLWAMREG